MNSAQRLYMGTSKEFSHYFCLNMDVLQLSTNWLTCTDQCACNRWSALLSRWLWACFSHWIPICNHSHIRVYPRDCALDGSRASWPQPAFCKWFPKTHCWWHLCLWMHSIWGMLLLVASGWKILTVGVMLKDSDRKAPIFWAKKGPSSYKCCLGWWAACPPITWHIFSRSSLASGKCMLVTDNSRPTKCNQCLWRIGKTIQSPKNIVCAWKWSYSPFPHQRKFKSVERIAMPSQWSHNAISSLVDSGDDYHWCQ